MDSLSVEIDEPSKEEAHRPKSELAEGLDPAHPSGDFGFHPQRVGHSCDEIERDHHTDRVEILPRREGGGKRGPDVLRGDLRRASCDLDCQRNERLEIRGDRGRQRIGLEDTS